MRLSGIENSQKTTNNEYRLSLHRFLSNIKFKFKIISRLYGLFLQSRFFDLSCKDGVNVRNRLNRIVGFLTFFVYSLIDNLRGEYIERRTIRRFAMEDIKSNYIVIVRRYEVNLRIVKANYQKSLTDMKKTSK